MRPAADLTLNWGMHVWEFPPRTYVRVDFPPGGWHCSLWQGLRNNKPAVSLFEFYFLSLAWSVKLILTPCSSLNPGQESYWHVSLLYCTNLAHCLARRRSTHFCWIELKFSLCHPPLNFILCILLLNFNYLLPLHQSSWLPGRRGSVFAVSVSSISWLVLIWPDCFSPKLSPFWDYK